jgi:hypothetical protein
MIIYKAYWEDPNSGNCQSWHSRKSDAEKAVADAKKILRDSDIENHCDEDQCFDGEPSGIDEVVIAPGKRNLIRWLNLHFTQDNG